MPLLWRIFVGNAIVLGVADDRRAGRPPDLQLAQVFVHRSVLIVPVTEGRRVPGIVTRSDFFAALAQRFLEGT